MSRVHKYRESLYKFINDKYVNLFDLPTDVKVYISDNLKDHDMMFAIFLLTVVNNSNKKTNCQIQCYHIAAAAEMLLFLSRVNNDLQKSIDKVGVMNTVQMINVLNLNISMAIQRNIESIRLSLGENQQLGQIICSIWEAWNKCQIRLNDCKKYNVITTKKKCNKTLSDWYFKDDKKLISQVNTMFQISKESMFEYIELFCLTIINFCLSCAWIIGINEKKDLTNLCKTYAYMYKISLDFENITNDVTTSIKTNYVVNFGIQNAYEVFLSNKEKFVSELMDIDMFTVTISEIIDSFEEKIDLVIDTSSPDLKSSYSSSSYKIN